MPPKYATGNDVNDTFVVNEREQRRMVNGKWVRKNAKTIDGLSNVSTSIVPFYDIESIDARKCGVS